MREGRARARLCAGRTRVRPAVHPVSLGVRVVKGVKGVKGESLFLYMRA